jgi:hypothetical protein
MSNPYLPEGFAERVEFEKAAAAAANMPEPAGLAFRELEAEAHVSTSSLEEVDEQSDEPEPAPINAEDVQLVFVFAEVSLRHYANGTRLELQSVHAVADELSIIFEYVAPHGPVEIELHADDFDEGSRERAAFSTLFDNLVVRQ